MSSNKEDLSAGSGKAQGERRRPMRAAAEDDSPSLRVGSVKGSVYSTIAYDAKGNPILEWRRNVPLRRADDASRSFEKYLENAKLRLAEDNWIAKAKRPARGYNPYDKPPK
jgi:hypothetical protein